jgi:hypothetical protein
MGTVSEVHLKTLFAVVLNESGEKYVTPVDGDVCLKKQTLRTCSMIRSISDFYFDTSKHTVECFVCQPLRFIL